MDALFFQVGSGQNRSFFIRRALDFLIVPEGKVNIEIRCKALFQKFFYRIHFSSQHGFTVFGTPSPEASFIHFSSKGRMAPLLFMNGRHHVLVSHEKNRLFLRIFRFPVEKKTCLSDSGEGQLFENQRPGLLHILVEPVKLGPVSVFIIHRRNGRNLNYPLEMGHIFFFCIHHNLPVHDEEGRASSLSPL